MKKILLACFFLSATCSVTSIQHATAQSTPPVTLATFTARINLMDTYIGASNMTAANATWTEVHNMMLSVLAVSKQSIYSATSPADKDAHVLILNNQTSAYQEVWALKTDLALNRAAIHTKLVAFGALIY